MLQNVAAASSNKGSNGFKLVAKEAIADFESPDKLATCDVWLESGPLAPGIHTTKSDSAVILKSASKVSASVTSASNAEVMGATHDRTHDTKSETSEATLINDTNLRMYSPMSTLYVVASASQRLANVRNSATRFMSVNPASQDAYSTAGISFDNRAACS